MTTTLPSDTEELENVFLSMQKAFAGLDDLPYNSNEPQYQHAVQQLVQQAVVIATCIEKFAIFSKNEQLEDVNSEDVKYLLNNYYLGILFTKFFTKAEDPANTPKIRTKNLNQAINNLKLFLSRCDDMQMIQKQDKALYAQFVDKQKKAATTNAFDAANSDRMSKIERTKRKMALEKELEQKQMLVDKLLAQHANGSDFDQAERDYYVTKVAVAIIDALEQFSFIEQEMQMLNFALEQGPALQQQQGKQQPFAQQQQSSNLKMIPLDKNASQQLQTTIIPFGQNGGKAIRFLPNQKQQIIENMFKNPNPPTMSLDEFADDEYHAMLEREEKDKAAKKQQEAEADSDDEKMVDKKTYKDRDWDDWKDANPKGMGNMLK